MRNTLRIISAVLFLITSISFTALGSDTYKVVILQDGKTVEVIDHVVELEKKEFQIKVILNNHDGVFMSASYSRDYYDLKEDEAIKDYKWLSHKVRAEKNFNENKELVVDDEIVSYLFYDKTQNWHRFDKGVITKGDSVIGMKTIRRIFNEDSKEKILLSDGRKDIFLFFVATDDSKSDELPKELGRLKIHLKWK